ncbi:hypothetical protein [Xanthomonas sacchari]|uniref:DUF4431 domain-containing protein n=1 Tax=Xanthomonas sacchari TaxID=56458 RepID=A0A2P5YZ32_9XANT|nr:hypothetical protein [Xanthomonas sacchari]MDV0440454.1 hypothetical protein [Xanthomonas sacchari]PPU80113.1 hypothetical protein XsacCFBP4641_19235 [Xanthomonas sacchari]
MPSRTLSLFPLLLIGTAPTLMAAPKHCLPYGPTQVTLSGTLAPSPPESAAPTAPHAHAHADAAAAATQEEVLILPQPLCVAASADGHQPRHEQVRQLRLAVTADQAAHLREEGSGQVVRVTGRLAHAPAGPDAPPLRLSVLGVDSD